MRVNISLGKRGKIPPCTFTRRSYDGKDNPFYGKKHSEEFKNKMREFASKQTGINGHNWKGDKVKYDGLHRWIRKTLGSAKSCRFCKEDKKQRYNWASKEHSYLRDVNEWINLCVKCHRKYDKEWKSEKGNCK